MIPLTKSVEMYLFSWCGLLHFTKWYGLYNTVILIPALVQQSSFFDQVITVVVERSFISTLMHEHQSVWPIICSAEVLNCTAHHIALDASPLNNSIDHLYSCVLINVRYYVICDHPWINQPFTANINFTI